MNILIVDDEPLARDRLQDLLEDIGGHQVVGEAGNGEQALSLCQASRPDVVLLDIHMPGLSGLEVARQLRQQATPPIVIFTTAYGDHALEAFEHSAIDYLLKPIRESRLAQALDKARALLHSRGQNTAGDSPARQHISVQSMGSIKLIPIEDIYYFQSDSKYVVIYHRQGENLIDEPLKSLEQEFQQHFTRIHRRTLVANAYIKSLDKLGDGQYRLRLSECESALEVSRRQLANVKKIINRL